MMSEGYSPVCRSADGLVARQDDLDPAGHARWEHKHRLSPSRWMGPDRHQPAPVPDQHLHDSQRVAGLRSRLPPTTVRCRSSDGRWRH